MINNYRLLKNTGPITGLIVLMISLLIFLGSCTQKGNTEKDGEKNTQTSSQASKMAGLEEEDQRVATTYEPTKQTNLSDSTTKSVGNFDSVSEVLSKTEPLKYLPAETQLLIQIENIKNLSGMMDYHQLLKIANVPIDQAEQFWKLIETKPFPYPENLGEYGIENTKPIGFALWGKPGKAQLSFYASVNNADLLETFLKKLATTNADKITLLEEKEGDTIIYSMQEKGQAKQATFSFITRPFLLVNTASDNQSVNPKEGIKQLLKLKDGKNLFSDADFSKTVANEKVKGNAFLFISKHLDAKTLDDKGEFSQYLDYLNGLLIGIHLEPSIVKLMISIYAPNEKMDLLTKNISCTSSAMLSSLSEAPLGILSMCFSVGNFFDWIFGNKAISNKLDNAQIKEISKSYESIEKTFNQQYAPYQFRKDFINEMSGGISMIAYKMPASMNPQDLDLLITLGISDSTKIKSILSKILEKNYIIPATKKVDDKEYQILSNEQWGVTPLLSVQKDKLIVAFKEERMKQALTKSNDAWKGLVKSKLAMEAFDQSNFTLYVDAKTLSDAFPIGLLLMGSQLGDVYANLQSATLDVDNQPDMNTTVVSLSLEGTKDLLSKTEAWLQEQIKRQGAPMTGIPKNKPNPMSEGDVKKKDTVGK